MNLPLPSRYQKDSDLASGGQGKIYVYKDRFLDRLVAVKTLHDASSGDLRRELASSSRVRSPHVAEMYELVEMGKPFGSALISEYVAGQSLEDFCLTEMPAKFSHTMWQIAKGVEDIHASGLIHRDLKPENLRFDVEGVLKILDFGISMPFGSSRTLHGRGSRHYAAPELYDEILPIELEAACDVYAAGVLAWYLGNKRELPSFLWDSRRDKSRPTRSISDVVAGLSTPLVACLDAAVSLSPSTRPSASELRKLLQREVLRRLWHV